MNKTIIGYKGFDQKLKCKDHQFEFGKEYHHEGDVKLCHRGFHFCEHPLDVLSYYNPYKSRFCEVEAEGVSHEREEDSKRVCKTIRVKAELTIHALINATVKFTLDRVDWTKKTENKDEKKAASNSGNYGAASNSGYKGVASNSGDYGAASNSGDYGAASNSGNYGAASNSGNYGAASNSGYKGAASNSGYKGTASNSGKEGVAISIGIEAKAKAILGTWLILSEWEQDDLGEWHRIDVKSINVDGKKIKGDAWYMLKNGKFVETD